MQHLLKCREQIKWQGWEERGKGEALASQAIQTLYYALQTRNPILKCSLGEATSIPRLCLSFSAILLFILSSSSCPYT